MKAINVPAAFPATHWSEVARAGSADPAVKREALAKLLGAYIPAIKAHLVHRGIGSDQADDLLQGFICDEIVADDLIARADRTRGRFRSFLLVALDRYVARMARRQYADKRHPHTPILSIDDVEPADPNPSADIFDLAWAHEVVQRAIRQMREHCLCGERQNLWLIFQSCTLGPLLEGRSPPPHAATVEKLGLHSPQQISNTLVTAKRMFGRMLRTIVGEYLHDHLEIEAELRDLLRILSHDDRRVRSID